MLTDPVQHLTFIHHTMSTDIAAIEFADNPEPRCACVLLLDTSWSMAGQPIQELNTALGQFRDALSRDAQASARVEVAVVTFGNGGVNVAQEFVSASDFSPPHLTADEVTPLGGGLHQALDLIAHRKGDYKANCVDYYRPWIILITDGAPTDEWEDAVARLHSEVAAKKVLCWSFGVEGADASVLARISPDCARTLSGQHGAFEKIFRWVSSSMARVSQSTPGDQTSLDDLPGQGIRIST